MSPPARTVLAVGLAAWVAGAVVIWLGAAPLGHDESQYAIAAQDLLAGRPERWFYLSKGMSFVALPGVLAGGGELALRLAPLLLGLGFVLAAWWAARRAFGDETAAWTVAVLASARPFMRQSAELLSDMPAAACLLAATAVILGELRGAAVARGAVPDEGSAGAAVSDAGSAGQGGAGGAVSGADGADGPVSGAGGPRWRIVLAAPLLAAALYLRYASCVPIALLGAAWLLLGWRDLLRRPAPAAATAALFALLLLPHALAAIALTGSPLGILLESGRAAPNDFVGQGLRGYLTGSPFARFGLLVPPLLLAGLCTVRPRAPRAFLLWLVGVPSIIAIALITQAQTRYIFFGTTLLAILGVDTLRRAVSRLAPRPRRALAALLAAAAATAWLLLLPGQLRHGAHRVASSASVLRAAEAIRRDAAGRPCQFLAQQYTQLEWYSGCRTAEVEAYPPPGVLLYVMRDHTPGWQPSLSGQPARHATLLDIPGLVHVERIEPGR